ncbi:hypothetical protein [Dongia sp.]|uniref:hypothetical protein n=1 Tax=Dongia sp. TaxID=1977262 RepID=UPI0035ADF011
MDKKDAGAVARPKVQVLQEGLIVKGGVNPTTTQIPQRPSPPPALKPITTQPAISPTTQSKPK